MDNPCIKELTSRGITFEQIKLTRPVHTVKDVQDACGCSQASVIKTLLFIATDPVLALLTGDRSADLAKLKAALNEDDLRMAKKEEVVAMTGYSVGSVTPFGIPTTIRQIADIALTTLPFLIFGGGQNDTLIKLSQEEFVRAYRGEIGLIRTD